MIASYGYNQYGYRPQIKQDSMSFVRFDLYYLVYTPFSNSSTLVFYVKSLHCKNKSTNKRDYSVPNKTAVFL